MHLHFVPEPERAGLVAELKQLYQASKFDDILASVESYLPKDSQNNFILNKEIRCGPRNAGVPCRADVGDE